jgi:hypothetical protein
MIMKTPDAVDNALIDMNEADRAVAEELIYKYVKYSEYVTIDFDTEAKTATVRTVY